jgi:hypothetical protein
MDYQMKLLVGEGDSRIEIDTVPQVMANASPVFRSMLQPDRFLEGQKLLENKPFTVTLAEDDPAAMKILCDIFHLRNDRVPLKEMTPALMASIAKVVDKYDCAIAVQLWPKLWLEHSKMMPASQDFETMELHEIIGWIHISCHLGLKDRFAICTSLLLRKASKGDLYGDQQLQGFGELPGKLQGKSFSVSQSMPPDFDHSRGYPKCSRVLYSLAVGSLP